MEMIFPKNDDLHFQTVEYRPLFLEDGSLDIAHAISKCMFSSNRKVKYRRRIQENQLCLLCSLPFERLFPS